MIRELWHTRRTLLGALVLTIAAPLTVADEQGKGAQSYYYEDIARFFAAYERFLGSGEETAFADYLERGTKGLKNFADQFSLSPEYLAKTVQKYPAFFSSIRDACCEYSRQTIRKHFSRSAGCRRTSRHPMHWGLRPCNEPQAFLNDSDLPTLTRPPVIHGRVGCGPARRCPPAAPPAPDGGAILV